MGLTEYKSTRVFMFKTIAFCRPIILEAEYIQNLLWNYELFTPLNLLTHYAKQPAKFSDFKGLVQKIGFGFSDLESYVS